MTDHVVMLSGGLCSFIAAIRVLKKQNREDVTLLFCDTLVEDSDLYRFMSDCERALNHPITRISEGRTPWQLFHDEGMIGNTRADLCSRILKRELADNWVRENCSPIPVLYFGFDFTEGHRLEGVRKSKPWAMCEAPLLEPPYLWQQDMIDLANVYGIIPSRAYTDGFSHDNCGGRCIKAGQGHWKLLLEKRPDVYAEEEKQELLFRENTGKDVAILRDRRGGDTKPYTLKRFRESIEASVKIDEDDVGGCNCFVPPEADDY